MPYEPRYVPLKLIGSVEPGIEEVELDSGRGSAIPPSVAKQLDGEGHPLGEFTWSRCLGVSADVISAMIPMSFIVLGISVTILDGRSESQFGRLIQKVIAFSPTVFPIVFAATVGKFFKLVALYKAERGVDLKTLEQLTGCHSLFGAVERQVLLRGTNLVGMCIVLLWALSPLGGQSALRLLTTVPSVVRHSEIIRFAPIELANSTKLATGTGSVQGAVSYGPIYMAALMTTRNEERSSMDLWGNVKIPAIESLSTTDGIDYEVDDTRPIEYTSLLGIPLGMLPASGNSSFNALSRYWKVNCYNKYTIDDLMWNNELGSFTMTPGPLWTNVTATGEQSFDLMSLSGFGGSDGNSVTIFNCTLSTRDVMPKIECSGKHCRVVSMRFLDLPAEQRPDNDRVAILNTWITLPKITTLGYTGTIRGSTATEQWIIDPATDFSQVYQFVNLSTLSLDILNARLEKVYNTFWQSTFAAPYLLGNLSIEQKDYDNIHTLWGNFSFNSTSAQVESFEGMQYLCRWYFVITLCIVSGLLSLLASVSIVLRAMILAPDVLICASTLLRDNRYASPGVPSYMDGLEATRNMSGVRVMLGDVAKEKDVGHVALATAAAQPQRLRKRRLYY